MFATDKTHDSTAVSYHYLVDIQKVNESLQLNSLWLVCKLQPLLFTSTLNCGACQDISMSFATCCVRKEDYVGIEKSVGWHGLSLEEAANVHWSWLCTTWGNQATQ